MDLATFSRPPANNGYTEGFGPVLGIMDISGRYQRRRRLIFVSDLILSWALAQST